jgi:hypothetical protein
MVRLNHDLAGLVERARKGPCFVCAYLTGHPGYEHEPIYRDDKVGAFLSRYPTLLGYTIVAPRAHVIDVTGDRDLFRRATDVVHDVAEALKATVPTEDLSHVPGHPSGQRPRALACRAVAARGALRTSAVPRRNGRERHPREQARLAGRIQSALRAIRGG